MTDEHEALESESIPVLEPADETDSDSRHPQKSSKRTSAIVFSSIGLCLALIAGFVIFWGWDALEYSETKPQFYGISQFFGLVFGKVLVAAGFLLGTVATALSVAGICSVRSLLTTIALAISIIPMIAGAVLFYSF